MESKEIDVNEIVKNISKKIEESLEQKKPENKTADKRFVKKFLVFMYMVSSVLLLILFTPYKQFAYFGNNPTFVGNRGFQPIFLFNELERTFNERLSIYYIDIQVLVIEILALTIIFLGLYFLCSNKD